MNKYDAKRLAARLRHKGIAANIPEGADSFNTVNGRIWNWLADQSDLPGGPPGGGDWEWYTMRVTGLVHEMDKWPYQPGQHVRVDGGSTGDYYGVIKKLDWITKDKSVHEAWPETNPGAVVDVYHWDGSPVEGMSIVVWNTEVLEARASKWEGLWPTSSTRPERGPAERPAAPATTSTWMGSCAGT